MMIFHLLCPEKRALAKNDKVLQLINLNIFFLTEVCNFLMSIVRTDKDRVGSICRKDKARCISSLDWIGKVSLQPSLCFAAQIVTYLVHNATSSTSDQLLSQMPSLLLQAIDAVFSAGGSNIPSSYTEKYFAFQALPSLPA